MTKTLFFMVIAFAGYSVSAQTECMDLTNYTDQYLDFVSTDDVVFAPGSSFITTGGLNYIKIDPNDVYQTINGDTLTFSGNIGVNVQYFDCSNYVLQMGISNPTGMVIDGTVVFSGGNPPATSTGPTFTFISSGTGIYELQGMFSNVVISSPSTQLYDVCFTCVGMGLNDLENEALTIFPNPTEDIITLQIPTENASISVYDMTGRMAMKADVHASSTSLNVSELPQGVYRAVCTFENGHSTSKLLFKN